MSIDFRDWPDGEPVGCVRDESEPRYRGFVRVGAQFFAFLSVTVRTAEVPVLVTSFYLVVTREEALADKRRLGMAPDAGHPRYWFSGSDASVPREVRRLMRGRKDLVYRVTAHESPWTGDLDGPLQRAIEQLRAELRARSAWDLREIRKEQLVIMLSEREEDELRRLELEAYVRRDRDTYEPYSDDHPDDSWTWAVGSRATFRGPLFGASRSLRGCDRCGPEGAPRVDARRTGAPRSCATAQLRIARTPRRTPRDADAQRAA
jgi:hypothetical protein